VYVRTRLNSTCCYSLLCDLRPLTGDVKDGDNGELISTRSNKPAVLLTKQPVSAASQRDEDDDDIDGDNEGGSGSREEELVLRVVCDPGVGLGMTISGGVGTPAVKDGDEVPAVVVAALLHYFSNC